jgi:hypothetical protein
MDDSAPEPFVAEVRMAKVAPGVWRFIDAGLDVEVADSTKGFLRGLIGGPTFSVRYDEYSMQLSLRHDKMKGLSSWGEEVWYSLSRQTQMKDSYGPLGGRFGIGSEVFEWKRHHSGLRFVATTTAGQEVLLARRAWKDSEKQTEWLMQWKDKPEDESCQVAVLIAPWACGCLAFAETSSG